MMGSGCSISAQPQRKICKQNITDDQCSRWTWSIEELSTSTPPPEVSQVRKEEEVSTSQRGEGIYCIKYSGWSESFSNLLASSCMLSFIFNIAADSVWSCKESDLQWVSVSLQSTGVPQLNYYSTGKVSSFIPLKIHQSWTQEFGQRRPLLHLTPTFPFSGRTTRISTSMHFKTERDICEN